MYADYHGSTLLPLQMLLIDFVIYFWYHRCKALAYRGRDKNGPHFADDIFKCVFLNENIWIAINISLKFIPDGPINSIFLNENV